MGAGLSGNGRLRSLWKNGDFLRLWGAETVSQVGSQVTLLALPLTAVLILKVDAFQMGILAALETLPFLLMALLVGVWVDRSRRRPFLIAGDLGRALALFSIPVAYLFDALTIWQLYIVAAFTGVCTVFFDVAYQAYLPAVVERDQLIEGNSKLEVSRSGAQVAGPGLAGLVVQIFRAPSAILLDAISFVASALFVASIKKSELPPPEPEARSGIGGEIAEGFRVILRSRFLSAIAVSTATINLFASGVWAIYFLFAARDLHLSPGAIGAVLSVGNLGFLAGAFAADRISARIGIGWAIVLGMVVSGLGMVSLIPATRGNAIPVLVSAQLLVAFGSTVYNVTQISLRQAITPARVMGRMNATMRFIIWGTMPVGGFLGGALAHSIGVRTAVIIGAAGSILAFLPLALSPIRRLKDIAQTFVTEVAPEEAVRGKAMVVEGPGAVPPA